MSLGQILSIIKELIPSNFSSAGRSQTWSSEECGTCTHILKFAPLAFKCCLCFSLSKIPEVKQHSWFLKFLCREIIFVEPSSNNLQLVEFCFKFAIASSPHLRSWKHSFLLSVGHLATIMFIFVNKTNQATHPGWAQTVSAQGSAAARPEDAPPWHFPLVLLLQRHRTWWQLHQSCLSSPFPHPRLQSGLGGSSSPKSGTGWGFPKWAFWFSDISFAFSCMNPQSLADV